MKHDNPLPASVLHWCARCNEHVEADDAGACLGCDAVIDAVAAAERDEAEIAEAFAQDNWTPRITWNLTGNGIVP